MIKFKDGNDVFEIKTSNIQQIVKEFARKIFSDAKVDRKTGRQLLVNLDWILINFIVGSDHTKLYIKITMKVSTIRFGVLIK